MNLSGEEIKKLAEHAGFIVNVPFRRSKMVKKGDTITFEKPPGGKELLTKEFGVSRDRPNGSKLFVWDTEFPENGVRYL